MLPQIKMYLKKEKSKMELIIITIKNIILILLDKKL